MVTNPLISVAICTYNRVDRLIYALAGICQQSLPTDSFEVLVVDNASTDNTKEICDQFQNRLPNLIYLYEPIRGLSKARNTALLHACSPYIAYLDDDAIPCIDWLKTILDTFKNVEPTPICVGGAIYPIWEVPKPNWVHPYMEDLFSLLNYGTEQRWFESPKFPYGANMTYQRESLNKVGGFCERLGRKGYNLLSEEEHLLNLILEKQGGRFFYNPQASVQHWVPKTRINPNWIVRRSYWQGRSVAMVDFIMGKSIKEQRWVSIWKVISLANLKRILAQFWFNRRVRVWTRLWLYWNWGYFVQTWFYLSQDEVILVNPKEEELNSINP